MSRCILGAGLNFSNTDFSLFKRLHDAGFALHWLKPRSKMPLNSGWTTGPRLDWQDFLSQYEPGLNVGVRLGLPSVVAGGYLHVIDVDVKSTDTKAQAAAEKALEENFPWLDSLTVFSGRGGGSRHVYFLSKTPTVRMKKIVSDESCKVFMPSVQPSAREAKELTKEELKKGLRIRPAWEIDVLTTGRQVVLPPSVHPDSGKAYTWGAFKDTIENSLMFHEITEGMGGSSTGEGAADSHRLASSPSGEKKVYDFDWIDLDDIGFKPEMRAAIETGEGVNDRSSYLLKICLAMLARDREENEIISLCTDRNFWIGDTAFDHAKTESRDRAAWWIETQVLKRAKQIKEDERRQALSILEVTDISAPADPSKIARGEVEGLPPWAHQLDWTNSKPIRLRNTLKNALLILENRFGKFIARNDFVLNDFYLVDTPWSKAGDEVKNDDFIRIKAWLLFEYRYEASVAIITEAITELALKWRHHPLREWLSSLEWDGVPRAEKLWSKYLGCPMDERYQDAVARIFMLAMIRRIFEPGCKYDSMVILEGSQGIGKSRFGNVLVGREYFMDGLPPLRDKDAALNLTGKWLCEFAELSGIAKSEVEETKAFITREVDSLRPPYGRKKENFPRQTVFLGTTNEVEYLKDDTGNRRYLPIRTVQLNEADLIADRAQLFAEAMFWYQMGERQLWLDGDAKRLAEEMQESRRSVNDTDDMAEALEAWIVKNRPVKIRNADLFEGVDAPLEAYRKDFYSQKRVGLIMQSQGYERTKSNGVRVWKDARALSEKIKRAGKV